MSDRERPALQLHFSTLVVLFLAASVLLYVATRAADGAGGGLVFGCGAVFGLGPLAIWLEERIHRRRLPPREPEAPVNMAEHALPADYWKDQDPPPPQSLE